MFHVDGQTYIPPVGFQHFLLRHIDSVWQFKVVVLTRVFAVAMFGGIRSVTDAVDGPAATLAELRQDDAGRVGGNDRLRPASPALTLLGSIVADLLCAWCYRAVDTLDGFRLPDTCHHRCLPDKVLACQHIVGVHLNDDVTSL